MTTSQLTNSISPATMSHFLLLPLMLVCLALLAAPYAFAVSPAPDGGYANGNTAEAGFELFNTNTGTFNTAIGNSALYGNTTGTYNTATGSNALANNTTGNNNVANGGGALASNTTASGNTANGADAMYNGTGSN